LWKRPVPWASPYPSFPAIKPFAKLYTDHAGAQDLPLRHATALAEAAVRCQTDEDAKALGIEWTTRQCEELYAAGVRNNHFYTVSAVDSVVEIVRNLGF
jgi:methylenetetrahydrofolate reductase (NADPH)